MKTSGNVLTQSNWSSPLCPELNTNVRFKLEWNIAEVSCFIVHPARPRLWVVLPHWLPIRVETVVTGDQQCGDELDY